MLQALKKLPYKVDILIVATMLLLSIAEPVHIDRAFYYDGLANRPSGAPGLIFCYEPLKIAVLVFAVITVFWNLAVSRKPLARITTAFLSILIFVGSWVFYGSPAHRAGAVPFLQGFEKWVVNNIDLPAVQTWILSAESDIYLQRGYRGPDFRDNLPDFLTNFGPRSIDFHGDESEMGRCVEFAWGYVFGNWGVVIGSPTMKAQQEGRIQIRESTVEFRRPVAPGIYVYSRG